MYGDLGGWCSADEMSALVSLAAGRRILEIGTWAGRSAIPMAGVAKEVWCLDHFCGDADTGLKDTLSEFLTNCQKYGVRDKIRLLIGDMWEVLPMLGLSRFNMFYYDADHSYEATHWALQYLLRGSRDGDKIVLHDYNDNHPQVRQAIDELRELYDRNIRVVGSLAILES